MYGEPLKVITVQRALLSILKENYSYILKENKSCISRLTVWVDRLLP